MFYTSKLSAINPLQKFLLMTTVVIAASSASAQKQTSSLNAEYVYNKTHVVEVRQEDGSTAKYAEGTFCLKKGTTYFCELTGLTARLLFDSLGKRKEKAGLSCFEEQRATAADPFHGIESELYTVHVCHLK